MLHDLEQAIDNEKLAKAALAALPERYRNVVWRRLGFEDGREWLFKEIAASDGVSMARSQQMYHKALRMMRKSLRKYGICIKEEKPWHERFAHERIVVDYQPPPAMQIEHILAYRRNLLEVSANVAIFSMRLGLSNDEIANRFHMKPQQVQDILHN